MPNPIISSMTIPVKNASTGEVSNQTFDLPAGGTSYSAITESELTTGTATDLRVVRADYLHDAINSMIDAKVGTALAASY